jgi:hypothetical protein
MCHVLPFEVMEAGAGSAVEEKDDMRKKAIGVLKWLFQV